MQIDDPRNRSDYLKSLGFFDLSCKLHNMKFVDPIYFR